MPLAAGLKLRDEELESGTRPAIVRTLVIALLIVAAGLRLWQYLANASVWLDEVAVARNVLDRSLWSLLTTPLSYDQTAPKGFLLVEKIATLLFGRSEYVLRFFPLASSLVALFAFWRIVERLLNGLAVPVALALFATATPLVTFGSQMKQYSSDVAVALLLLCLALGLAPPDLGIRRALWTGIAGAVLIWFSQPAVLVVCGLSVPLILFAWNQRRADRPRPLRLLSITLGCWAASALGATLAGFASITPATQEYLHQFWAAGFPPALSRLIQTRWPLNQIRGVIGAGAEGSLGYPLPTFYISLAILGFWILWQRNRQSAALLVAPIVVTLAAAVARQYPFGDRLVLFLVPSFFVAVAASAEEIRRRLTPRSRFLGVSALVLIVGSALYPMINTPPVYHVEEIKPLLSYLRAKRRLGDLIYVYYGAAPAVSFYANSHGLREDDYGIGGCHRGDSRRYFEELDPYRASPRVWVVITHALPFYRERTDIVRYLDTIGVRRDRFAVQPRLPSDGGLPAELLLYDLSDPERLSRAMSDSSPVTGGSAENAGSGCGEGPQSIVQSRGLPLRGLAVR